MLSIDINLDPFGHVERRKSLTIIAIWNDGSGDRESGCYEWAISHQPDSLYGWLAADQSGISAPTAKDLVQGGPWVWKSGTVKNFERSKGSVALLGKVLTAAKLT